MEKSPEELALPLWLCQERPPAWPEVSRERWLRVHYLEKTWRAIQNILLSDGEQEKLLDRNGLLQRLEPRSKVLGSFLLLIALAGAQQVLTLCLLHGLLCLLAGVSRIGWHYYGRRVLLPTLLFSGWLLLPALTGHIVPGEALFSLTGPSGYVLTITRPGVTAAVTVLLRTAGSLGTVLLVMATTRWDTLTKTMACLGGPGSLVMVLDMTYRYLFLFLQLLEEYIMGRKSRMVAGEDQKNSREWIGLALAGFFRMAMEYSREIEAAMRERGYTGRYSYQPPGKLRLVDAVFPALMLVICFRVWGS